MRVELNRIDDAYNFEAVNEEGKSILLDAGPGIGGKGNGVRPMQTLLMAMGACSGIDVVSILKKQKQHIDGFRMIIDGEREAGKEPSLWKDIHVGFRLSGPMDAAKVSRAVKLSITKYCSVAKTLETRATITYDIQLNDQTIPNEHE